MKKNILPVLLPVRCIIFVLLFVVGSKIVQKDLISISNWWSVAATAVNVITIILIVLFAGIRKQSYWEVIGYQKGKTKLKQIVTVSVLIFAAAMAGMNIAGVLCYGVFPYAAPMLIAPIPKALAVINVFLLPITTAFAEDGLYLGCGVNSIKNKACAIFIPAFFFALQHSFIPTLFDLRYMVYRFFSFLPLTIVLCWYYYKNRNPLPIMIGHAIVDVATVMQILATSMIPGFYETMCGM